MGGFHGHERTTAQTHDWITPRHILDALGPFDLDPCMSLHQPWETASSGFTVLDDGLSREWSGHVWLNPPYGSQIAEWMERLARHGDGIALVFARSDTKWFQSVSKTAAAMLFLSGRVRFHDTRGGKFQRTGGGSCATSPSVLIGYGERAKETLLKCPLEGVKLCPPNVKVRSPLTGSADRSRVNTAMPQRPKPAAGQGLMRHALCVPSMGTL